MPGPPQWHCFCFPSHPLISFKRSANADWPGCLRRKVRGSVGPQLSSLIPAQAQESMAKISKATTENLQMHKINAYRYTLLSIETFFSKIELSFQSCFRLSAKLNGKHRESHVSHLPPMQPLHRQHPTELSGVSVTIYEPTWKLHYYLKVSFHQSSLLVLYILWVLLNL